MVTLDDATSEHTSMFFCDQEGTNSSFHGLGQTMARYGLFASVYTATRTILAMNSLYWMCVKGKAREQMGE